MNTAASRALSASLGLVILSAGLPSIGARRTVEDDPTRAWTSVGATGTLDESSIGLARFGSNGAVAVLESVPLPATLTIRYNVVAVDGLFATGSEGLPHCLNVGVRDNGAGAHVVVRVKEVGLGDVGTPRTLATFNSDLTEPAPDYRRNLVCTHQLAFDFYRHAYFVEAQLVKTSRDGEPGLQMMNIALDFQ
jgi:hypothetical protein